MMNFICTPSLETMSSIPERIVNQFMGWQKVKTACSFCLKQILHDQSRKLCKSQLCLDKQKDVMSLEKHQSFV